ncbi:beta-galactosidase [Virgisporangium aliadipatigenens]|uniref:Beta-galactosidase n=1 Tax=Virgisporangium aliadipatigenens TaxID=741659 RepID=A0A8J4DN93_9ACTN|nr:beta-galactosidase [Virgisporangium aliadipatigenens]GIJ44154.1 beta-galactosidase [Virgisporangium aliadipatigenens]
MEYGGDYNPEQWPEKVWAEDVALMREAGVTLVTLGVFAWSRLEPRPGEYDLGWLDRVFDLLHEGGVRISLATPTASPPPWFSDAHPEALPVGADGTRLLHGSRDTYCAASPAYRAAARRIAQVLAHRYGGHPALALWHVHNEYGTECHCDLAAAAFREWLRARYSTVDALNDAWSTDFWSQRYTDWAQIRPPRATRYLPNPAQLLDFRRFWSDELLAAYVEQRDVLRPTRVPVTTNFVFGGWVPVDHARWAKEVDVVAIDHYPSAPGLAGAAQTAFASDLARGWAGGRPWLLCETAPYHVGTPGRMHTKAPGQLARDVVPSIARGSHGAMFFQWRASRGGAERYHSALVPHAGPQSRQFRETVAVGALLRRIGGSEGRIRAATAMLFDAPSWWALQAPGLPSDDIDYLHEVRAAHRALSRLGMGVDVLPADAPLDGYRVVVVPALYLLENGDRLREYVAGGGRLVVTFLSGIADPCGRVYTGGYPGALRDLLGIRVTEFHPMPADLTVELSTGDVGRHWAETVETHGAEAVATYPDGGAAITRHRHGDGAAWYVSTRLDDDAYARLLAWVIGDDESRGHDAPLVPYGVDLVRRTANGQGWLFAVNHTDRPQPLPADGTDLVTGNPAGGTIPPGGVAVVKFL